MKKQTNQRWQSLLLAAIATIIMLGAHTTTFAQKGVGAEYGARDPRTCADTKSPTRGAMTTALATKYVICAQEHVGAGEDLYLIENVNVQVGAGRPYNRSDNYLSDADTTGTIYPIRGGFDQYQCAAISKIYYNKGMNCTLYHNQKASGVCYKTSFGDWHCNMQDLSDNYRIEYKLPPPGGAATAAAPATDKPAVAVKADNQSTAAKADADGNKDANGYPKPDFSEMEKWYEIVRYEYPEPPDNVMWIYFKPKVENRPVGFYIEFRDKDGIEIDDKGYLGFDGPGLQSPKVGEMGKTSVYILSEKYMKAAVSAKVIRRIQ